MTTLSFFTNSASMMANNSLSRANAAAQSSSEQLATGKRLNRASDGASDLQITTRLSSQSSGMDAAKRNINAGKGLLQTSEGASNEVISIMDRMKVLATTSANETNATTDRDALQSEFKSLNDELKNIMKNTNYGGDKLFATASGASGEIQASGAKFNGASGVYLQIGEGKDENMRVELSTQLKDMVSSINALGKFSLAVSGTNISAATASATAAIEVINGALKNVGTVQSSIGAYVNRLDHTLNNLNNMQDNTKLAISSLRDTNVAEAATNQVRNQLLMQTSMKMLKQSNQLPGMLMSLID